VTIGQRRSVPWHGTRVSFVDPKFGPLKLLLSSFRVINDNCPETVAVRLCHYDTSACLHRIISVNRLINRSVNQSIGHSVSQSVNQSIKSSPLPILSGVVQGSCLGPVLFIVFTNDITDLFSGGTCVKLFADDVKLYSKVYTNPHSLQEGLNRIVEWSRTWQLPISDSKCCTFDLVVQEVVDLGVTMDNGLKFSKHIAKLTVFVKGHRMTNLILKCFLSRDVNSLVTAFTTYIRLRLEYCSVAWNPALKKDIESLEKVHRRFTKRLPGLQHFTYCQRLSRLQLESLELRRLRFDLVFTYKMVFGLIDVNLSDFFKLRSDNRNRGHKYKLFLPGCSSSARQLFHLPCSKDVERLTV